MRHPLAQPHCAHPGPNAPTCQHAGHARRAPHGKTFEPARDTLMARLLIAVVASLLAWLPAARAGEPDSRGVDFFEKKIRPVLVEHCYACHSQEAKKVRAELLLDTRDGLLKGGESGPAVVPGNPGKSLLLQALRQTDDLRMPPNKKLPDAVIADFAKWIEMGAPDPRRPSGTLKPRRTAFLITDEDRNHWAFRPVADPALPALKNADWARNGIDHFILAKLE